mgnify:CR=1 FL=1
MAQRYCKACGNALSDTEKFCAACGAPADDAAPAQAAGGFVDNGAVPQEAKQGGGAAAALAGKKNLIIIIAAVVVVAIIAIVVIMNLTKYQTIDAKELVRVEFKGMDGKGTAVAVLNTDTQEYDEKKDKMVTVAGSDYLVQKGDDDYKDRLLKAYDKAKDRNDAKDMQDVIIDTNKEGELRNISFDLSDEKGLKNGDTITVTVDFDEDEFKEAGIKLENTEFEVTVEGLNTVETIDLFEYVDVKFDGYDGFGTYSVEKKDSIPDDISDYVDFGKYDYASDLKNGDKVKVQAYVYGNYDDGDGGVFLKTKDDKYYDYGYKSGEELTKEFEVSGLKELAEFDPMADVTVEFSGIGPYTVSTVNKDALTEEIRNELSYSYDWSKEYNIGDSVEITVYAYSGLKDLGYKLKGNTNSDGEYVYAITLTEDMVPVMVTSKDDVGALSEAAEKLYTDKLDEIKEYYKDSRYIGDVHLENDPKSWSDFELEKSYLVTRKQMTSNSYDDNAILARIYKVTITDEKNKKVEAHVIVYGYNLVKVNGELSLTNDYMRNDTKEKLGDYKDYFDKDDYTMTALS